MQGVGRPSPQTGVSVRTCRHQYWDRQCLWRRGGPNPQFPAEEATMTDPTARPLRCAVYTRKSTEHNLDLAFTSLDAQREAYIRSQAGEGWRLVPEPYDDGGLSGASLDRPALQALLAAVRASRIDVVVVYKVDRLTRSLADFAKLIEIFDAHATSFVSVTQSFNTTTSMGRLTLNILLSFAQFEREVIGERVRDKIAASKRKGIWVGGPVPLGYAAIDKKAIVVPAEAKTVRAIFTRYLELGAVKALAEDLERRGIRTKQRQLKDGRIIGGVAFGVGGLAHLLKNRFYIGEVVYCGETFRGDHEPILDPALFATVQAKLAAQAVERRCRIRGLPALLTGRLFDEQGRHITPTHTNKKGVRYSYYVSQAALRKQPAGSIGRVPAPELEALVLDAVRHHLQANSTAPNPILESDRELIERHLLRATLSSKAITLHLRQEIVEAETSGPHHEPAAGSPAAAETKVTIVWTVPAAVPVKGIVHVPAHNTPMKPGGRETLLIAIAKARKWLKEVERGRTFADIANREGKAERHIRHLARLAFVSPRIITAIIDGTAPAEIAATTLITGLSLSWAEQEQRLAHEPARARHPRHRPSAPLS
jgi:site-specific DNA recombinase